MTSFRHLNHNEPVISKIMKIKNPIIPGFYPDPSICLAEGKYYLVTSSFHYFPGVPIFESVDLINWQQIGHCLTRESQIMLNEVPSSGGVFAPTIRYNNGRFYMTTTNASTNQNFIVFTDDIYGDWSDPIYIEQDGIDPSLYFEKDRVFFMTNGTDDQGEHGIVQCEINIRTGQKIKPSLCIWKGSGGRYLESPHLYKINNYYYLMVAEGGTEYGHMVTYARAENPYGPFIPYEKNPVLTNRNLGGYEIQGVGHGDLVRFSDGNYYMVHLAFRQIGRWDNFHHLGRETFIVPVTFDENNWFEAGSYGTSLDTYDIPHLTIPQTCKREESFMNTDLEHDWIYLRHPHRENYILSQDSFQLKGTDQSLSQPSSPTFIGIRQKQFNGIISSHLTLDEGEAGISLYMDENHHYDLAIEKVKEGYRVIERLCIGNIKSIENTYNLGELNFATLEIEATNKTYTFKTKLDSQIIVLGEAFTKYLSSEVATGFTGVIIGLYAYNTGQHYAKFKDFHVIYK